ncbi:hypothetical protein I3843_15G056000 [Carya illinoinensis]|nr:hypothetical protein I3843_15G056000 [Carya illinoinensis]
MTLKVRSKALPHDEQPLSYFRKKDANHDGFLSKEELQEGFKELSSRIPKTRAQHALNHADGNGDGLISLDQELCGVIEYAEGKGF